MAARILLEGVAKGHLNPDQLAATARHAGVEIAQHGLAQALAETGYEPVIENGEVRFRNCPFHLLGEQDRETTCGLNLALVEGMLEGAASEDHAVFVPVDTYCCVRLPAESLT